ncbi:hypothetical protein [Mycobacterium sp. NPDC050853]|uniref:hypothetical protein n=1 Tax=Mycobacterium sp. NPDC050853 TaxID=3155160 RepID=UPI0033FD9029
MRIDKPTHIAESNLAKMRTSDFTEEIPGQLAAGINRLGTKGYTYYSIYPVAPEVRYDEFPYSPERIQACGRDGRLTVEIKRLEADGVRRHYTIGRPSAADESETEVVYNGDSAYPVRPSEVLAPTEAIRLFLHYYDHNDAAPGWNLREQPEFADAG